MTPSRLSGGLKWVEWVSPAMRNGARDLSEGTLCALYGRAHEVDEGKETVERRGTQQDKRSMPVGQ